MSEFEERTLESAAKDHVILSNHGRIEVVYFLQEPRANVNAKSHKGIVSLQLAAAKVHIKVVNFPFEQLEIIEFSGTGAYSDFHGKLSNAPLDKLPMHSSSFLCRSNLSHICDCLKFAFLLWNRLQHC